MHTAEALKLLSQERHYFFPSFLEHDIEKIKKFR
jgi:hypothetical protein